MEKKDYFRDNDEGWIMQQILLDNLALGEGIPLRVIRLKELRDLYQHFCNAQDEKDKDKGDGNDHFNFTASFLDKSSFDKFSKQAVDWFINTESTEDNLGISSKFSGLKSLYEYLSNEIFPVLPSNLHSLEFLSQTIIKYWRIYSVLWLYQELGCDDAAILDGNKSTPLKKVYGCDNCWARYQMVKIRDEDDGDDHDVLLLAGPVFEVDVEVLTNETDVDTVVTNKAERLLASLIKRTADSSHDSGSYFRQAIQLETVRQEKFLLKRFDNVLRIWDLLYNASINTKISHKYLRMLTVWAQHVSRISHESEIDNVFLTSDGLYGEKRRNVQLSAMKKEGTWCIEMESLSLDANDAVESTLTKDEFQIDKQTDKQTDKFYDLYTRLERKTKQLDKNRLIVMDLWLESQFSAPLNTSDKESPGEDDVGYRLATWICAALRADVTMIHAYHPEEFEHPLKVQEIFIREKKYQKFRANTIVGMQNLPKAKRDLSNIYGVLRTGSERICLDRTLASDSKNDANDALCKIEISLKDMYTEWPRENAEMVVPIKFNGRVLGAIEVISIGRWRFRWGQSMLLLNIATNLGAYWYQQRHLSCLSEIQTKVLDFNQEKCDQKALYDEICKQAAVLFLCKGAGLWLRDNIDHDLFIREGAHAVTIVDGKQSVKAGNTFIAATVKAAKNSTAIRCKSVDKGDAISEENRGKLAELGIKYVTHLPIRDKEGEKVIAILSLYDNSGREFDKSWHFIAQFFAGHLHVIIDSVAAVLRERGGIKQMALHQIWDSGSHLADKAEKIAAPISSRVDDLNQVYTTLKAPGVVEKLKIAKMMGEIPKNRDIYSDLEKIIRHLSDHSGQPLADVKEQAFKLRNQVCVFSAEFEDDYEPMLRRRYAQEPERIRHLMQRCRNYLLKTDPIFTMFLINEGLVDAESERVDLRAEIAAVATSGHHHTAKDFSAVDATVVLHINSSALNTVLTNLWVNARKYRINESDPIFWSTEFTKPGGCKLQISNPSITYSDEALRQLITKGYQHPQWRGIDRGRRAREGFNKGLGLYLVDNLCRHVLNISFEVKQHVYADGRSDFICELIFNPNFVTLKR